MDIFETLNDPKLIGLGPSALRDAEQDVGLKDKRGATIVSADTHFEVTEDIYYKNFPAHLKHKAPRVWFDGFWRFGRIEDAAVLGQPTAFTELAARFREQHSCSGLHDLALRQQDMEREGVDKEIVFPQSILHFFRYPEYEMRESAFSVYNDYVARLGKASGGRFYGVGVCPNWWSANAARETIQGIKAIGLKTFLLPTNPGNYPSGKPINYADEEMDALWDAVEEADLPVCFHVIEKFDVDARGGVGTFIMNALAPFRVPLAQLMFGGIFDRHPKLKVVFAEGGIAWVPVALQDAELIYDSFGDLLQPRPLHRPSHYWRNNCYATFQHDRLGLELLRYIGEDNVMWASDYPHTEGTYGYTGHSQQAIIDATSPSTARKILGETAVKVFKL